MSERTTIAYQPALDGVRALAVAAVLLFHAEVVSRNGRPVGYVRSGSYGYTLGGAVGLFMIEADEAIDQAYIDAGKWEIDIAGKVYPASVSLSPLYDPGMEKIKR